MKTLIVLEGCDGVGKTSCATNLAEEIRAVYYKTPPKVFESLKGAVESCGDYNSRFYYYLSGMCYAAHEINEILKNSHVVCDRYIYSTIVYHRLLGVTIPSDVENLVPVPDYGFCLHACDSVVRQRLSERESFGVFDNNFEIQHRAFEEYKTFNLRLFDTSDLKTEESVFQIKKIIHL
ncbi:MAG: AAA family ATPase [Candidatus Falkowbacteria bacterium]